MLIRLTSELKSSFNSVCDSKGLTPSDEIRRLIVEYVTQNLNKGISAKTGVEDDVNDDNLDLFLQQLLRRNRALFFDDIQRQISICLFFCLFGYDFDIRYL